jgi:sugar phosphate isomerase/epimerase
MIHLGLHTDNWRPLSLSFEAACDKIVAAGLKHVEFAVTHGQYFIQALGYDPSVSLQSSPRALRRYLEKKGLEPSQIDGAYPMMGPNGSAFGVQYVQQSIRFAAELGCPMVDTVDGAFETPGMTRDQLRKVYESAKEEGSKLFSRERFDAFRKSSSAPKPPADEPAPKKTAKIIASTMIIAAITSDARQ